jgi:hypothetical protein
MGRTLILTGRRNVLSDEYFRLLFMPFRESRFLTRTKLTLPETSRLRASDPLVVLASGAVDLTLSVVLVGTEVTRNVPLNDVFAAPSIRTFSPTASPRAGAVVIVVVFVGPVSLL